MFGLGKNRSKVGKFFDKNRMTQEQICKKAGIGRNTATRVCSDPDYVPSPTVMKKIMKVIRSIEPGAKVDDYFDM